MQAVRHAGKLRLMSLLLAMDDEPRISRLSRGGCQMETTSKNAADKWRKSLKYVQFSKRMVVCISLGLFILSLISIYMSYLITEAEAIVKIVTIDGYYAIFAFIAYSGNSMLEKWLIKKGGGILGSEIASTENTENNE